MILHRLLLALLVTPSIVAAQDRPAKVSDRIGFSPKMGIRLPIDARFHNHLGQPVTFGDLFSDRPVIVVPVYYRCPMLCGLELKGLVRCLRGLSLDAGQDFDIITFSIDPREGPALAAQKRKAFLAELGKPVPEDGWHFLAGDATSIDVTCKALGFRTEFDARTGQYAHAAGLVVCTSDGRIARYFYGVEFPPRDMRLALVEASEGAVGTLSDHVQLYCYMYDPTTGRYGIAILAIVRVAGVLTALALFGSVGWMLYRERRNVALNRKLGALHG